MDLKNFIEKEFDCEIDLDDDELKEFLYYYDVGVYDEEQIKNELSEDLMIDDYLIDFINIEELAENQNYIYISDDCYVDNNGLHYFERCYNEYGKNIEDMINDWRE